MQHVYNVHFLLNSCFKVQIMYIYIMYIMYISTQFLSVIELKILISVFRHCSLVPIWKIQLNPLDAVSYNPWSQTRVELGGRFPSDADYPSSQCEPPPTGRDERTSWTVNWDDFPATNKIRHFYNQNISGLRFHKY